MRVGGVSIAPRSGLGSTDRRIFGRGHRIARNLRGSSFARKIRRGTDLLWTHRLIGRRSSNAKVEAKIVSETQRTLS
jgi:hypothetical protein